MQTINAPPEAPERAARRSHRARTILLVALAVVLGAEAGTRVISAQLPEPQDWYHPEVQRRADDLVRLRQLHRSPAVVFVGSSSTGNSLNPRAFKRLDICHRQAFNAAAPSSTPELWTRWIDEGVLAHSRPKIVVIGFTSRDFAAGVSRDALSAYEASRATRRDTFGRLDRWLSQRSYLVRYRPILRDPRKLWATLRHRRTKDEARARLIALDGFNYAHRQLPYQHGTKAEQRLARGYRLNHRELVSFRWLIRRLRARGIVVVVANLPVTHEWKTWHPGGPAAYVGIVKTIGSAATASGAQFVDLGRGVESQSRFVDPVHLNRRGSVAVTQTLVADLRGTCHD
jgi:hypothetical protein